MALMNKQIIDFILMIWVNNIHYTVTQIEFQLQGVVTPSDKRLEFISGFSGTIDNHRHCKIQLKTFLSLKIFECRQHIASLLYSSWISLKEREMYKNEDLHRTTVLTTDFK